MSALFPNAARDWLGDHLHAFVWILLALWTPPVVFSVMVDVHLAGGAGGGYPTLRDPGLLLDIMQIVLMAASLPLMRRHHMRAWRLLSGALGVWFVHAAWVIQGRLRLIGRRDLLSRETLIALAALAVASIVLMAVRDRRRNVSAQPTTDRPRAALQLDTR
jgi:hypothetical protein